MVASSEQVNATSLTKVEFSVENIDLNQPTTVLSQLNIWLNDEVKPMEQRVQLRKRKMNISMWKITESSELMNKTVAIKKPNSNARLN